ncbi:hypothetical protein L1987_15587 [Smallanthus sonchifolius]|uniref:Uncharacterized protein n=1 Tax=Smallanthus sonchifolius TaxID=185202 RepID=A0ACB9J5W3_9ASTR|nr:hypothetical protein L1987_15587 [Smallanthus sonchifolius]
MELVKKECDHIIPRKRSSDDSNDLDLAKFRKQKPMVQAVRDFPPGCGVKEADRKPLKNIRNVHSNPAGKMTDENNKPNEFGTTNPEIVSRPTVVNQRKPLRHLDNVDMNLGKTISPSFRFKMELVKKECDHIIPRKRSSDDSNDLDLAKFRKQKPMVQAVRDFPPGCGVKEADRKPLKKIRNVHSNPAGKMTDENNKPNEFGTTNPEIVSRPTVVNQRKPLRHLDNVDMNLGKTISPRFSRNKSSVGSKPAGKVKFWEPTCTKAGHGQQPKVTTTIVSRGKPFKNLDNVDINLRKLTSNGEQKLVESQPVDNKPSFGPKEHAQREKIKEAISIFDQVYSQLYQDNRLKPKGEKMAHWRVPMEAAKVVKQMPKWMEPEKSLGPICGVQIGDQFKYRSQLKMIGLHFQFQSGGLKFLGRKLPPEDQKLKRGNLALKNSMDERTPVRVIRKLEGVQKNEVFVYDGLYAVNHYTEKRNEEGNIVYKFHLHRVPGQPPLHQMMNARR